MEHQGNISGQAQMMKESLNQPSDVHSQAHAPAQSQGQSTNFIQQTGDGVSNMVQGVADVGKGATQSVFSLARGVAVGAANVAQGASDVVKNTVGANDNKK